MVLGNVGTVEDRPTLEQALGDPEPLVRSHAAWALGRLRSPSAVERLRTHLRTEPDPGVRFRAEIESALQAVAC